jgi:hypothetical protein
MAYTTNRDRNTPQQELTKAPWPLSPLNLILLGGSKGVVDLKWDDPSILPLNSRFIIFGVNVYRSFDSEFGPFQRLTPYPLGTPFWRDQTDVEVMVNEDVTDRFIVFGAPSTGQYPNRYIFKTLYPIVQSGSQGVVNNDPFDVQVFVDGVQARVLRIDGHVGEVEIDPTNYPNVATQKLDQAVVPTTTSKVSCSYRRLRSLVRTDMMQRIFYRVTTVGIPFCNNMSQCSTMDIVETPLESATATSSYEIEKLDWVWREAVRRNRWILEQGGERVRVFLQKNVGIPCPCIPDSHHNQPISDCDKCWGTGILGGYEGPYETIIAPDDAERRRSQKETGRSIEHSYEVFTGPSPILSQRDFLVKINGDRYSVGPVRFPTNRGMVLQQHFNIGHLDENDIRNRVPLGNPVKYASVEFGPKPPEEGGPTPVTEKTNIPDERELRGHTVTWENIVY